MAASSTFTPKASLTDAPTNLKEAIDWVLRVTGKDGKKNIKNGNGPHCLCYLAKAVKDLLYDARSPGTPGPSTERYWDGILLEQEESIVQPVLTDLGLDSNDNNNPNGCGGTEVIKALIDQLAQGLQKWVGWKDGEECCLKGTGGIGKECTCNAVGVGTNCCTGAGVSAATPCHECTTCGPKATGNNKCYLSAYCKPTTPPTEGQYYWPSISSDSDKVHLLARIFLGSVCLIWSGLSQLGFLTKEGRWKDGALSKETENLGSFMAAMGYDLDRLNQGGPGNTGKKGEDVFGMLTGAIKDLKEGTDKSSVAEYYSEIYEKAKKALKKNKKTEDICKQYPLLVLHILASGYFRAGSAGAKNITSAKPATGSAASGTTNKDTPPPRKPRHPRTIREILYWLSALPYSEKYRELVGRMDGKMKDILPKEEQEKGELKLHGENIGKTTLLQKDITHYLLAACGYCPLVLIGIQGTIENKVDNAATQAAGKTEPAKKCEKHKTNPNAKRCVYDEKKTTTAEAAPQAQSTTGKPLEKGQVCYGGYHLEVSSFGPLHGMYANGLFGFDMDGSPAQCLDQLRTYVYHCFYQLYFLRKQCGAGVESGVAGGAKTVLGWQSCRYGSGLSFTSSTWLCSASSTVGVKGSGNDCQCKTVGGKDSPLMSFLCDGISIMACRETLGVGVGSNKQSYPEIDAHMNKSVDSNGREQDPHRKYPQICPVPMGWSAESGNSDTQRRENHFKDLSKTHKTEELKNTQADTYPAHCTGNTLALLLEYYCDPVQCHGSLVVLLRLLACITPTVPRTLGDLFGFYYYMVYIGGQSAGGGGKDVHKKLGDLEKEVLLYMGKGDAVVQALTTWKGDSSVGGGCQHKANDGSLRTLYGCTKGTGQCSQYLSPLSGQQYGQLSPAMAGTYLSWLVYLIEGFNTGVS